MLKLIALSASVGLFALGSGIAVAQDDGVPTAPPEAPLGHLQVDGTPWPQIETAEHVLLVANANNLASRWQNIIVRAKSGDEQLTWMRESGVFAEDFRIAFNMPGGERYEFTGLDTAGPFYNPFLEGMTKERANVGGPIEVLEYLDDGLRFRFRYLIFMDERMSLAGMNEVVMRDVEGRYQLTESDIFVSFIDVDHAYASEE